MTKNSTPPSAGNIRSDESSTTALREPLEDSPSLTVKDKQLKATLYLKEASERLNDVATELTALDCNLNPESVNLDRTQRSYLFTLRKTLIPFIQSSARNIRDASKTVTPIGGTEYLHNRNEVTRKQTAAHDAVATENVDNRYKKSLQLLRIEKANHRRTPLQPIINTVRPNPYTSRNGKRKRNLPTIHRKVGLIDNK